MYKKHKVICFIAVVASFFAAYIFNMDYSKIADDAMTLISIVIAVYITVASVLMGSTYAAAIKRIPDKINKGNSLLGTLKDYLTDSMAFSILSIIISALYSLKVINIGELWNGKIDGDRLFSAFSCSIFALNIFLWLIFRLMMVIMLNSAVLEEKNKNHTE